MHTKVNVFLLVTGLILCFSCIQTKEISQLERNSHRSRIDHMLDAWHHAAATADEDIFFGSMTQDGIYIGTDSSECWSRDEMATWSAQYFQRDTAWAFVPISRNIYVNTAGDMAWFDELLNTWMGVCRGSGVVQKQDNNTWKINHYHLSIAVPNDVVSQYLELLKTKK